MKLKLSLMLLCLSASAAHAEETMQNLAAAANAIAEQLTLGNNLTDAIHNYGHSTTIVADGTTDPGLIDQSLVDAYNAAINDVLNASYMTAQDVFIQEHQAAIDNLHQSIDTLVDATAVLATVVAVADMAESANTTQDQLQVQAALASTDMSISQADVDTYNAALGAVESYAQQAAAFLSAANNPNVTAAVDNYAAANGVAVASYTAITYTQSIDQLIVEFGTQAYLEFNGAFTANMKDAADVWGQVGYGG